MNDTVVARPCWTILANKAEDKITLIQNEMAYTRKHLEGLKGSEARVKKMYDEYLQSLTQPNTQSLGMREAMNQRQFMAQLSTLMLRVQTDIQYTENALLGIKERLIEAERERIKMQPLFEKKRTKKTSAAWMPWVSCNSI